MPDVSWRTKPPRTNRSWFPPSESRGASRSVLVSCCETRILPPNHSVRASKDCLTGCRFTSVDALSFNSTLRLIKGDYTYCSFRLLFNSQFCCAVFGPFHPYKAPFFRDNFFELLIAVSIMGILISEFFCSLEKRLLHIF